MKHLRNHSVQSAFTSKQKGEYLKVTFKQGETGKTHEL